MKILKLLIRKLIILSLCLFCNLVYSNEPVDIWNIEKNKSNSNSDNKINTENKIDIKTQTANQVVSIEEDQKISIEKKTFLEFMIQQKMIFL